MSDVWYRISRYLQGYRQGVARKPRQEDGPNGYPLAKELQSRHIDKLEEWYMYQMENSHKEQNHAPSRMKRKTFIFPSMLFLNRNKRKA